MSIEGYKKIRTVGKGAFGTAILYRKVSSDILVVIKEINMIELTETEKQMALNEVQILSSLCHPNIIQYLGSLEVDGVLMIEMEYADGGTLAQLISRSSFLRELEILSLFKQCVAAIEYMHKNNILHRDLKTANVFLTTNKLIKVGDFGISKMLTTKGQAQTVLGTPYYISPEMCEGKQYDTKSDVWALGCILYEMACLHKTFRGENLSALVNNIMKVNFEPIPSTYSEGFRRLVTYLLQKDPSFRPNATDILTQVRLLLIQNETNAVSQKNVRSVLYKVSGKNCSFSCIPIHLPGTLEVMQVAVSSNHYITVSRNHVVHTWGEGKLGQLGHGEGTMWLQHPTVVQSLSDRQIVGVGAGDGFSVFLSDSGILMTCGDGTFGCLGQGDFKSVSTPKVVETLINEEVKQVACGIHHCAALTRNGALFTWGRGDFGQLGTGVEHNCCEPVRVVVKLGDVIKSVHCGPDCTAFITKKGCVYVCGCNRYNKLGLIQPLLPICRQKTLTISKFQKMSTITTWPVVDISLGNNHSAALTECGQVITMGSNAEKQLGHSSTTPHTVIAVDDKVAKSVICGPTYTVMTTVQNVLYFWGTRYLSEEMDCTSMTSLVHREVAECPHEILALYASPAQISQGEIITVKSICSLWDSILLLVDTTVPLVVPEVNENQQQNTDYASVSSIPKWISKELSLAKHS